MKSATTADVKKAQAQGYLEENIMYLFGTRFVHGKRAPQTLNWFLQRHTGLPTALLAETADGEIIDVDLRHICSADKGPSQQPKRSKHKPVKGTRPETLVPMSSDVKLKVGDKVVLSDGSRAKVVEVDLYTEVGVPYRLTGGKRWYRYSGDGFCHLVHIPHKILPWTPPAPAYKPEDVAFKKAEKCDEELAFDKGYWVPFIATAQTACPEWAKECRVEVLVCGAETKQDISLYGYHWDWGNHGNTSRIVAYRKAQQ